MFIPSGKSTAQLTADLFCFGLTWLMVGVNVQEPAETKSEKKAQNMK